MAEQESFTHLPSYSLTYLVYSESLLTSSVSEL